MSGQISWMWYDYTISSMLVSQKKDNNFLYTSTYILCRRSRLTSFACHSGTLYVCIYVQYTYFLPRLVVFVVTVTPSYGCGTKDLRWLGTGAMKRESFGQHGI